MPNRSLPAERTAPKFMAPHFITSEALPDDGINLETALAAVGDFDFSAVEGADDPALLAESVEVVLSDAIRAKAEELEHSPVKIYNWVRNNIQWQPTWGAVQDSDLTLSAQRGNAFDIATLTIALLRASGIPARYVHGTIDVPEDRFRNWIGGFEHINAAIDYAASGGIPIRAVTSGGKITKVRMEYIWVEAALDFYPSRGAVNRKADIWVPLDPAFKQYEYLEGLDPVAISGLDPETLANQFLESGTVNEAEGWVTGFDPTILQNAQTQTQQALETHIEQNLPDATVGDVLGGRRIIPENMPILAGTLTNYTVATDLRYAELPNSMRQHIVFGFGTDVLGEPQQSVRFPWAQVNNQRITLSFKPATQADEDALRALLPEGEITDISQLPTSIPAYLVNVIPELKVGDDVVLSGSLMNLGEELAFVFTPEFAGRYAIPNKYNVIAGSYLAIAAIAGNVSSSAINENMARLKITKNVMENRNLNELASLTKEDLLGDLFHSGLLSYYGQYGALTYAAGLKQGGHQYIAAGLGSYGYEPEVDYFFGLPRAIHRGSVAMNLPMVNIWGYNTDGDDNSKQGKLNYIFQAGTLSSALEHIVPEQMFVTNENPGEAISAVKALSKATQSGQRIYHITQANQAAILPNINHDGSVLNEIRNALNAGKEVITHTDAVSVPGWSGAGYIIFDPVNGDGAYKISGGANGGALQILMYLHLFFLYIVAFIGLTVLAVMLFGLILAVGLALMTALTAVVAVAIAFLPQLLRLFSIFTGLNTSWQSVQNCSGLGAIAVSMAALTRMVFEIIAPTWIGIVTTLLGLRFPQPQASNC